MMSDSFCYRVRDNSGRFSNLAKVTLEIGLDPDFLFGDLNRDGNVGASDVELFIESVAWGLECEEADLNQDGFVDLRDIVYFAGLIDDWP